MIKNYLIADRVKIIPRGKKKIYTAEFSHEGKHCRKSLKTSNQKEAIRRATQLAANLTSGEFRKEVARTSLCDAQELYLSQLAFEERAESTQERYRGELNTFIQFCAARGIRNLAQIKPLHFDEYRKHRASTHAPATVYHESMVIKQFLNWCVSRHLLKESPLNRIKIPSVKSSCRRLVPTLEQVYQILESLSASQSIMLAILAFTGIRSGELKRLRKEDVDLKNNWIHIMSRKGAETKTRDSRKIPIHPNLRCILEHHHPTPGPWFLTAQASHQYPEGDHPINPKNLKVRVQATARQFGIPVGQKSNGLVLHSFRHFFETHAVNSGIPQKAIDSWMGHKSDHSMGAVYYQLSDAQSQKFMQDINFDPPQGNQ
ncbi:tyrosine-type recombinase/integrase [Rubinisphaera italica]|uniref:Tyrosine recombinase XerC n=1 Tax=Rubinisphaera italica TaxID=2527969 RepID=A0A5C5XLA7_9PLAN|nr:tyrosine-type recombinase/integrase [Rubinisphaera italica]TWT64006.1 Tyrosine recombinase XerC [Rubinisphaera italica]